jgi:hypothetical protein
MPWTHGNAGWPAQFKRRARQRAALRFRAMLAASLAELDTAHTARAGVASLRQRA